ncbi:MAG: M48 family metallopeptidase [Nitrospira sp.]|nr:MAG: M48 family metallopeptidase [Nitrospira sp.]
MTQFLPNALCYGEGFPGAGGPCHLEVTPDGLWFRLSEAPAELILYGMLSVRAGGFDHDHLVLTWAHPAGTRTLYFKDPAAILAFRRAAPSVLAAEFERTARRVRQARSRRRGWLLAGAGSVVGLMLFLWFGSDLLARSAARHVPIEWERQIGEAARADFLRNQAVLKDGPAVMAVQEMTKRLSDQIPENPYRFDVTVVRSDTVNAFALPGGYVVVFTGLMKKAESPEEVAGVLAHELNHVVQRHAMERIVKTLGLVAIASIVFGNQEGLVGLAKQLGIELLTLKFGREQETEADVTGIRLVHRAKIPPDGMIRFFEKLSESDKLHVELLSTHPMSTARAERLKQELASLPKQEPVPFSFEWTTLRASLEPEAPPSPK